jgi:diaminobutyrate-2-oxoglutarate transaminase
METIERVESEVRSYCRSFPTVFERARGHTLYDEDGKEYLDFFAGAGALNYGHNNPHMKRSVIDYLSKDGVVHSLDMATSAKTGLLVAFEKIILEPRGLRYKVQFPGPTGTNAVESALKLARKVTGRENVVSFTNAFHGMTLGSLAITGNAFKRGGAGVPLQNGTCVPFDGYFGEDTDTIDYIDAFLRDSGSGVDLPAAIIVETLQAEGGVNVASDDWLRRLQALCRDHEVLLIVDDIQVGCGRTGPFFSFERAGIEPDIVCLSKSISGYGLPMALTLIRPELDVWEPGEHNGTFRGHNPAFVTATAALDYWKTPEFQRQTEVKAGIMQRSLSRLCEALPEDLDVEVRGLGMLQGLAFGQAPLASRVCREAFEHGLIMETSGPESNVVKLMPPLTIDEAALEAGLERVWSAVDAVVGMPSRTPDRSAA